MSAEPAPAPMPKPEPAAVEIVRSTSAGSSVRVVLDLPLGATVQVTVETLAAATGAAESAAPIVTVKTTPRSEPAPIAAGSEAQPAAVLPERLDEHPSALPEQPGALAVAPLPAPSPRAAPGQPSRLTQAWARANAGLRAALAGQRAGAAPDASSPAAAPAWRSRWQSLIDIRSWSTGARLFALGLLLCAVTRLWAIDQFPIYFYSDEANSVNMAQHLLANHLRGTDGIWLPLYFEGDNGRWTPWLVVYAHLVTSSLFGKSIAVARATSAVIDLLAPLAVGLMLWRVFRSRYWWAASALIAAIPVLFIYARTSYEHSITPALFACFLLAYLLYRCVSSRYVYVALLAGAAVFYSYSNAQLMMAALAVLLLLVDFRYHWQQRALWPTAAILTAVLAAPLIIFRVVHPQGFEDHLRAVGSYWMQPLPLNEKLGQFVQQYALGLSPLYWFFPNSVDPTNGPSEHLLGYGALPWWLLPMVLAGLVVCFRQRLSPPYRTLLLAALVVPLGAAVDKIEIQRVASLAIPLVCLGVLGGEWLLGWLQRIPYKVKAAGVLLSLSFAALWMTGDSLLHGPLWFQDYGLYGMQYGVKQLFAESIPALLNADPSRQFIVSTAWANNVQYFPEFFLTPAQQTQISLGNVADYLQQKNNLADNNVFVMTAAEYGRVEASTVLTTVSLFKEIAYPNGTPGLYLARLAYTPDAAAQLAAVQSAKNQPQEATVNIDGQAVQVFYSFLSDGTIQHVFDGDPMTWARGAEANPFVIELHFPQPRSLAGLSVKVGSTPDFSVSAARTAPAGGPPETITQRFVNQPPDPQVNLSFAATGPASILRIEIKFNNEGDHAQIHIWDISLH